MRTPSINMVAVFFVFAVIFGVLPLFIVAKVLAGVRIEGSANRVMVALLYSFFLCVGYSLSSLPLMFLYSQLTGREFIYDLGRLATFPSVFFCVGVVFFCVNVIAIWTTDKLIEELELDNSMTLLKASLLIAICNLLTLLLLGIVV